MTDPDGDDHANEMEQEFYSMIDAEDDGDEGDYSAETTWTYAKSGVKR